MSRSGSARSTGCEASARISSSVAAASTSQNSFSASGRAWRIMPASSSVSNTPTPADQDDAPTVNIRQEGETKIEEFRTKEGRVYAVRVTPKIGKPYLLVDPDGKHPITSSGDIGTGVRPAQWTLFEF